MKTNVEILAELQKALDRRFAYQEKDMISAQDSLNSLRECELIVKIIGYICGTKDEI